MLGVETLRTSFPCNFLEDDSEMGAEESLMGFGEMGGVIFLCKRSWAEFSDLAFGTTI